MMVLATTAVWRMARVMVGKAGVPILTALPHPQLCNMRVKIYSYRKYQRIYFGKKHEEHFVSCSSVLPDK